MSLDKAVSLVQDMVAIPSVNPMGRDVKGDIYFEAGIAEFVEEQMKKLQLETEVWEVREGRPNVVGLWEQKGKPLLLLDSHLDTVPVEGMQNPFDPVLKDNQIFGRGSCDTKSTMSMFLTAIEELMSEGKKPEWSVLVAGTIDEELHAIGAHALTEKDYKIDFAILGEPTELNIIHAHKGCVRFHIETFGKSCHSSLPELGKNAFYTMAKIISSIEKLGLNVLPKIKHPELGSPTINPGTIKGGMSVNAVPDHCVLDIDVRTLPGQSVEEVFTWVREGLKDVDPTDYKINSPHLDAIAMYTDKNSKLSQSFQTCCHKHHAGTKFEVATYATDAQALEPVGIKSLVFGPGTIKVAHTINEFLPIKELDSSIRIMKEFLMTQPILNR